MANNTPVSDDMLWKKLQGYCAYQERSPKGTVARLMQWGASRQKAHVLLARLQDLGMVCAKRYAVAYARGHFYRAKWGSYKIRKGLQQEGIEEACIAHALQSIPEEDYQAGLLRVAARKRCSWPELSRVEQSQRLRAFLLGKGYTQQEIDACLQEESSGAADAWNA